MEERALIEKYVDHIPYILLGSDYSNVLFLLFSFYFHIIVYILQVLFVFTLYNSLDHNEKLKVWWISSQILFIHKMLWYTGP